MSDQAKPIEVQEKLESYAKILQRTIQELQSKERKYPIDAKIGASVHFIGATQNSDTIIKEADPK